MDISALLVCSHRILSADFLAKRSPGSLHTVIQRLLLDEESQYSELQSYSIYGGRPKCAVSHASESRQRSNGISHLYVRLLRQPPDISIFLHGQDYAWHIDGALEYSTAKSLNRLDLTEVLRRKYMNLRISWDNACPNWMNTSITIDSPEFSTKLKGEEAYMKDAFEALFPGDPLPEILAAPCCSQFAVTRDTIRSVPRERYQNAMSWLQNGSMSSSISGRIWEHLWHWLFLKRAVDCPDEHAALCRNYRICFESAGD